MGHWLRMSMVAAVLGCVSLRGADAAVKLVGDINPGPGNGATYGSEGPIRVGDYYFFTGTDGTHGLQLWIMDSDLNNLRMFRTPSAADTGEDYSALTEFGGKLYLVDEGEGTPGIFQVDPELGTMTLVRALPRSSVYPALGVGHVNLTKIGDKLYFRQWYIDDRGAELWVSDGTFGGTRVVKTFPTATTNTPALFTEFDGKMFFIVQTSSSSPVQLWVTDGTGDGTEVVYTFPDGTTDDDLPESNFVVAGNRFFFQFDHPTYGRELWAIDGGTTAPYMVSDLMPGSTGSDPVGLLAVGDTLYFLAADPVYGQEPRCVTPGSPASIQLVADISPGTYSSYYDGSEAALGDSAFFSMEESFRDGHYWPGNELYKASRTSGSGLVKDIYPDYESRPYSLVATDHHVFFFAKNAANGNELWKSDGTGAGTVLVADINPGTAGSDGVLVKPDNSRVFMWAKRNDVGFELWAYDEGFGDLTGRVWADANGDGIRQDEELPIQWVDVYLLDHFATEIDWTRTDADGRYTFKGLPPSDYRPRFALPAGFTFSPPLQGGDPTRDSNADINTGNGLIVGIEANKVVDHDDAGLIPGIIYVKQSARGEGTGEDWDNAFPELRDALDAALTGVQVWVATGFYLPSAEGDKTVQFYIRRGVSVIGGFAGNETRIEDVRPENNPVILSGDLDGGAGASEAGTADSYYDNNSHHVVYMRQQSFLYGVTVEGGSPDASKPGTWGGGIFADGTNVWVDNCVIWYNRAYWGAGAFCDQGRLSMTRCLFYNDNATFGGGVGGMNAQINLINCTLTGNYASESTSGGAFHTTDSAVDIRSSIIWYNYPYDYQYLRGSVAMYYCVVRGGFPGVGNLNLPPRFRDWWNYDFRPSAYSPAIDAGWDDNGEWVYQYDLAGVAYTDTNYVRNLGAAPRHYVDIGAYEFSNDPTIPVWTDLQPGWNQVSMPFSPDVSPTALFGEDTFTFRLVKTFRAGGDRYQGIQYSYEQATTIQPYESYWVYLPEEITDGRAVTTTQKWPLAGDAELTVGWNMVGFPYLIQVKEIYRKFPVILSIQEWDAINQRYRQMELDDYVCPLNGYLIFTYRAIRMPVGFPAD